MLEQTEEGVSADSAVLQGQLFDIETFLDDKLRPYITQRKALLKLMKRSKKGKKRGSSAELELTGSHLIACEWGVMVWQMWIWMHEVCRLRNSVHISATAPMCL